VSHRLSCLRGLLQEGAPPEADTFGGLQDINITAHRGELVAVVGSVGR
jgi:ABC-type polysaccharide/polyol phosphate transport system ATPase subunit